MDVSFLKWIDHAGFMLEINGKKVYIDPFRIRGSLPRADVIFLTHTHIDHFNEEDLKKIETPQTKFVAPMETAGKLGRRTVMAVEPGKSYGVGGISFSTVRAYNESKQFHPKVNNWVGYVIEAGGRRVYHAGDTDAIEEMRKVDADIALLPVGGNYTMDVSEAAKAAELINAKAFAPMHYKSLLGKQGYKKAEEEFMQKVKNSIVLEQIEEPYYSF